MKSRRATWLGLAMTLTAAWAAGAPADVWSDFKHGVPDGRIQSTAV
jgi:hypothetical protein